MRGYADSFNLLIINRDCRLCKNRNLLVSPLTYWFVNQFSQRVISICSNFVYIMSGISQ